MRKYKRFWAVLLALALLWGTLPMALAAQPQLGDIDANGTVDAVDALCALQQSVGIESPDFDLSVGELDGDGEITPVDAMLILQFFVGLLERFPVDTSAGTAKGINPYLPSQGPVYVQYAEEREVSGARTTYQVAAGYDPSIDIYADSVMLYCSTIAHTQTVFSSWKAAYPQRRFDVMIAINREDHEYVNRDPSHADDIQMDAAGNKVLHAGGSGYMVPTERFIEYKWELIQEILKNDVGFIAFEEPEMFKQSGYSPAFQAEWKAYYGTEWEDPASSVEAQLKSEELKAYLFTRIISVLGERIHAVAPDVKVFIALHSTPSYNSIATVAYNQYTALECVDGIIGQTWSDTAQLSFTLSGSKRTRVFEEAFMEYASYGDSLEGQLFYALSDPKADNGDFDWDTYERWYRQTVVASMMQQNIDRFELFPWPDRSFSPAPDRYKTTQLNVFSALQKLGGQASQLYGGTPGITFALSDSISSQYGASQIDGSTVDNFFGMTVPLLQLGIPVTVTALEKIQSAEDLKGVNLLILSYDCQKPLSETVNQAIAQWTREGGTVLYLGGFDQYEQIPDRWWMQKGQTPFENLLSHMGLEDIQRSVFTVDGYATLEWQGADGWFEEIEENELGAVYNGYTAQFEGTGYQTLIQAEGADLAIQADVGQGKLIAVGLPSIYYTDSMWSNDLLVGLTEYALQYTPVDFVTSRTLCVKRGDYIGGYSFLGNHTYEGQFIDLFDADLPVITQKENGQGEAILLYDISRLDTSVPRIAHTGGVIQGGVEETAQRTVFSITGPSRSVSATRIVGATHAPARVYAERGGTTVEVESVYDAQSSSLLLRVPNHPQQAVTITVEWE